MMEKLIGLPPVLRGEPKILVLGSMPGRRSLESQQYYAHPQNLFWRFILMRITGERAPQKLILSQENYSEYLERLERCHIALWDVLRACIRQGSLDSAIQAQSEEPNDFSVLLKAYSSIRRICFNGQKARSVFDKKVLPELRPQLSNIQLITLPSSSPANAAIAFEKKAEQWLAALSDFDS